MYEDFIIYELSMNHDPISRSILRSNGISNNNIKQLIRLNLIEEIDEDSYSIVVSGRLLEYIRFVSRTDKLKAIKMIKHFLDKDPYNQDLLLELFTLYVKMRKYDEAFKVIMFATRGRVSDEELKNYSFYIYLLSLLTEIPERYRDELLFINEESVRRTDNKLDAKTANILRERVFAENYKYAMSAIELNAIYKSRDLYISHLLLTAIVAIKDEQLNRIEGYIKGKEYSKISEDIRSHIKCHTTEDIMSYLGDVLDSYSRGIIPESCLEKYANTPKSQLECLVYSNRFSEAIEFVWLQAPDSRVMNIINDMLLLCASYDKSLRESVNVM